MPGELIGEFRGKTAGQRVLEILPTGPKMEITFRQNGKLLGIDAFDIATYWSVMTLPDVMYGEGQGTVMSKGGEMAMYRATGTMKMEKKGPMGVWRGVLYMQSPTPKWGALNGKAIAYEYEMDEDENTHVKLWEVK